MISDLCGRSCKWVNPYNDGTASSGTGTIRGVYPSPNVAMVARVLVEVLTVEEPAYGVEVGGIVDVNIMCVVLCPA